MNWLLLTHSLLVAAGTAAMACLLGGIAALFLVCSHAWTRTLLLGAGILTLALPPFLVVNSWLDALGQSVNLLCPAGTLWILTLLYWPIPMLALWMAWSRLDPALLEAEPAARGRQLIWHVLLPLGRPALALSAVLTFVLSMNNFSVPSILQTRVYPTEIWVRYNTGLSGGGALLASWPLVLAPLLFFLLLAKRTWRWPHTQPSLKPALLRAQLGPGWFTTAGMITALACMASVALPLGQLGLPAESWRALPRVLAAGADTTWNSAFYAAMAASLCTAAGLLLAPCRRAGWVRWVFWLLFFLPGSVAGIGLLASANPVLPETLRDSALLAVGALSLRHLAIAWTATSLGYEAADARLIDAARVDGASGWSLWRHAYWPQAWRYVAGSWYAVFLLSLWEVDSMILVAPPGGDTLAMRAFNLLHYGHTGEVNGICITLLGIALVPLGAFGMFRVLHGLGRSWARHAAGATALCLITSCAPQNSDSGHNLDSRIFKSAEVIGTRGAGLGQFSKPRSLALDAQDNLYVADMTGRVQKFSPSGEFLLSWQMPQTDLGKPKGMCRDAGGDIVVIEPHYSRINHYSPDGKLLLRWGQHGTNAGALAFPRAAGVNRDGQIFVSEYGLLERVQRFQMKDGKPPEFMNSFGSPGAGPGQFNRPEGLCVDPSGLVHVADSCNHRVQSFTAEGKLEGVYGRPGKGPGELSYPYDVCVDASGLRFVCEFGNSRIQVFDAKGNPVEIIGGPGSKPGEFNNPWSIALDSHGNLYVADSQNHRVQRLVRRETVSSAWQRFSTCCIACFQQASRSITEARTHEQGLRTGSPRSPWRRFPTCCIACFQQASRSITEARTHEQGLRTGSPRHSRLEVCATDLATVPRNPAAGK